MSPMALSWWRRLADWAPSTNPAARRCRCCGCIAHPERLWCPVCWGRQ